MLRRMIARLLRAHDRRMERRLAAHTRPDWTNFVIGQIYRENRWHHTLKYKA